MNEEKLPELSQLRGEGVNFYVEETENTIAQMINTSIVEFVGLLAIIAALFVFFKWVIKKKIVRRIFGYGQLPCWQACRFSPTGFFWWRIPNFI